MTISTVIGHRRAVHVTALGKCLVAFDADTQLPYEVADAGLPPRTPHSITDPAVWHREIAEVRRAGIAHDRGECEVAAQCIAAPILDQYGHAVAALSFSALTSTVDPEAFEASGLALRDVARRISGTDG